MSVVVVRLLVGGIQLAVIGEPVAPETAVFLGREPGQIALADTTGDKPREVEPCREKGAEDADTAVLDGDKVFGRLADCRFSVKVQPDKADAAGGTKTVLIDNETGEEVTPERIVVSDVFYRWIIKGSTRSRWCRWCHGSCCRSYEH